MRRFFAIALGVITVTALGAAQGSTWKADLDTALKEAYPITKTATFERNNITQPGVVLVIQKPNIMGENVHDSVYRVSTVEDGAAAAPKGAGGVFSSGSAKELQVGDKVYVRDISVGDDNVRLQLLTLEMYDMVEKGSTKRVRLLATVAFKFPKEQLASMKPEEVKHAIGAILLTESAAAAANTKTIELGQTIDQVEAILGKPLNIAKLGPKTIYSYKNMKVIFTDGKVSDVQ